ncbi:uroporphyrinogen-III C-methyltransferase [Neobacillus ginsengisoli]|uniref:uroporphyrinogen-III C-methyltransferase n=1 Tax=Neobacillus ginsengisoli TaxID=904295 RepID=A0ABT9Y260_9BACI|nr:uroporphyrinogen-III C-methyltransferase [Neobacillus ginsengisoli]MDQ0201615.1 uroporphyrinogen III methyltransferase/synthase [Neobacillus ginsengisoli]
MKTGKVFLVGAGPGDIGLITVKGLEAIKQAEVILYDRLANPKLLEFAPADCELIYCGKLPDRHTLRQENINDLLVAKALEDKMVVRLKGGDPGVFGRVGEEAAALADYQIPFEVVPGISSGIAAPLYAGIPVTHREYAESFAVVTAHDKSKDGKPLLHWEGLARGVDTIAFYMGVGNLPFICENLITHGKQANTPVILIQWGTFGRQRTLQGTLADITAKVAEAKFSNPAIILVGEVISLREKISWFEKKPLYGRQIVLARTGESPSQLAKELQEQGADVIEFPKWKKTAVPVDLEKASAYEKILFASPESVGEFFSALVENRVDIRNINADFFGASVKTIKALNERGFCASLAAEMPDSGELLIIGDDSILKNKPEYGDTLVTSKKVVDSQFFPIFKRMLEEAEVNTMVFPSSAAVEPFFEALKECEIDAREFFKSLHVICMGKQTMAAVETAGLKQAEMPEKATKQALIALLAGKPFVAE